MRVFFCKYLFVFFFIGFYSSNAQVSQTIRGTVLDQDTRSPLPGANVIIASTMQGVTTNGDGEFRIENVPVGRVNLVVSFIGYEEKILSNLLINSAKEVVLNIELTESVNTLEEVEVTSALNKAQPINEMALVSARTFSVEETKRYAGAIDDPARMVSSFAGVNNDPEGNNDIIVRGNSPRGILWRLEGVEIPNPNHFADEGNTGGPINALNSSMLGNSDFYTGAFAPQYGNALSGVFDMNLRTGNNQKREYSLQASTLGMDATVEGPFSKKHGGSYLANYRYSTLALLDAAGIVDFDGVPRYQDASFKISLPVNSRHSFSAFGLGGISAIFIEESTEEEPEKILSKGDLENRLGVIGASHVWRMSDKSYLRTSLTGSGTVAGFNYDVSDSNDVFSRDYFEDLNKYMLSGTSIFHHKINSKNKLKIGATYNYLGYRLFSQNFNEERNRLETLLDQDGNSGSLQSFVEWKHRFTEDFSIVGGAHYLHFLLNDEFSIEPRLAGQWQINDNQTITAGAGLHSRLESVVIYLGQQPQDDGSLTRPNTNLGPSKSAHFVLGYRNRLGEYTNLKIETYYQHLYNVPIVDEPNSPYSVLNASGGYTVRDLANGGTGRNYGLEITLEQYLKDGFYYLGTASLYRALYTAKDGIERPSAFDGGYVFNALGGKEFRMGRAEKNRVFFVNTKVALIGAKRFTPIDLAASIAEDGSVYDETNHLGERGDDIFKLDLAFGIRRNHKNVTTEWKVDLQNLTNNQAVTDVYYESSTQSFGYDYQLGMFPTLSYRVTF